jgi:hypothetical protein
MPGVPLLIATMGEPLTEEELATFQRFTDRTTPLRSVLTNCGVVWADAAARASDGGAGQPIWLAYAGTATSSPLVSGALFFCLPPT